MDIGVPVSSAKVVTLSDAHQLAMSSGQVTSVQVGPVLTTSGLTEAQFEEISLLSCEVQTLHGKLALDFIQLSHQEALFHMGAQSMGHEKAIQGCPDSSTGQRDEATQHSGEVTWLETNSLLFHHTLEHQDNMIQLIKRSQEAI